MNAITVYALRFVGGGIYVGITKDLCRRLEEHERRQSPSTKRLKGTFLLLCRRAASPFWNGHSRGERTWRRERTQQVESLNAFHELFC